MLQTLFKSEMCSNEMRNASVYIRLCVYRAPLGVFREPYMLFVPWPSGVERVFEVGADESSL